MKYDFLGVVVFGIVLLIGVAVIAAFITVGIFLIRALSRYIKSGNVRKEKSSIKKSLGEVLKQHREECKMTQEFVAESIGVSRQAVSKWETGAGLPDVSLLKDISALYDVDIEKILDGNLEEKGVEVGNMKRMKFTRCVHCGNIFWSTGGGEISCCGRKLTPLTAQPMDKMHDVKIEEIDNEYFVTFDHEMTKEHYIVFAALVSWDRATVVRLYPEQSGEVRLPRQRRGELYLCCNKDGLFRKGL